MNDFNFISSVNLLITAICFQMNIRSCVEFLRNYVKLMSYYKMNDFTFILMIMALKISLAEIETVRILLSG